MGEISLMKMSQSRSLSKVTPPLPTIPPLIRHPQKSPWQCPSRRSITTLPASDKTYRTESFIQFRIAELGADVAHAAVIWVKGLVFLKYDTSIIWGPHTNSAFHSVSAFHICFGCESVHEIKKKKEVITHTQKKIQLKLLTWLVQHFYQNKSI